MCLFDPPDSTYSLLIALWCVSLVRECFAVDIWFSVEICWNAVVILNFKLWSWKLLVCRLDEVNLRSRSSEVPCVCYTGEQACVCMIIPLWFWPYSRLQAKKGTAFGLCALLPVLIWLHLWLQIWWAYYVLLLTASECSKIAAPIATSHIFSDTAGWRYLWLWLALQALSLPVSANTFLVWKRSLCAPAFQHRLTCAPMSFRNLHERQRQNVRGRAVCEWKLGQDFVSGVVSVMPGGLLLKCLALFRSWMWHHMLAAFI